MIEHKILNVLTFSYTDDKQAWQTLSKVSFTTDILFVFPDKTDQIIDDEYGNIYLNTNTNVKLSAPISGVSWFDIPLNVKIYIPTAMSVQMSHPDFTDYGIQVRMTNATVQPVDIQHPTWDDAKIGRIITNPKVTGSLNIRRFNATSKIAGVITAGTKIARFHFIPTIPIFTADAEATTFVHICYSSEFYNNMNVYIQDWLSKTIIHK